MTDVLESMRRIFVPIHKEGYPFILIALFATFVLAWLWSPLGWIGAILTVWVCYFFRDPPRVTPVREGLVVSPADGRVSLITTAVPPPELDLPQEPMTRVSGSCGRSSSGGGTAVVMRLTRPSAGETTRPSRTGVTRGGSRKK